VNTTAECHVMQYVWAAEAEFVGFVEPSWIAVCRTVHHQYAGAGLHIEVADPGGATRHAEIRFDRAFDAHRYMIGIVCYPHRHFFAAFKDGSFYK